MAEPRRRIIVDGIEPGSIFRFPLILHAIPASFQPPRLAVAVVTLLVLVLAGRGWDAVRGPRLDAGAFGAVAPGEGVAAAARAAVVRWAPQAADDPALRDDPAAMVLAVDRGWRRWRLESDRNGAGGASGDGDPGDEAVDGAVAAIDSAAPGTGDPAAAQVPPGAGLITGALVSNDDRSMARYRTDRRAVAALLPRGEFAAAAGAVAAAVREIAQGLVSIEPRAAFGGLRRLFIQLPASLVRQAPLFAAVFGPLALVAWGFGGGAISRMAACRIGAGERLTAVRGLRFAWNARIELLLAPLMPLGAAAVLLVPAALLGLLTLVPGLDVVGGLLLGLAILPALAAALLVIGLVAGAPLIVASIATERCDAIDAAQRPYAAVLRRPAHVAGYLASAVVATAAAYLVAATVAGVGLDLLDGAATLAGRSPAMLDAGAPPVLESRGRPGPPADGAWHEALASRFVAFWHGAVMLLVAAATLSAWASTTTAAYLLARRAVDGQDEREIWYEGMVAGTIAPRAPGGEDRPAPGVDAANDPGGDAPDPSEDT